MPRRLRPLPRAPALVVLLLSGLAGCGREAASPTAPAPAETRARASARLRAALDARELAAAAAALDDLVERHGGLFELPDGRVLPEGAALGAVLDAAVAHARQAVERVPPGSAEAALALAERLAPEAPDEEARAALAAARRYAALHGVGDLGPLLAPHDGPRVLVVADDFDLGEPGATAALARWAAAGRAGGLRVGVLPMLRGWVRVGTRRVRARDRDEQRTALAARLAGTGAELEPEPASAQEAAAALGLLRQDQAVLVFARTGALVARRAGRSLPLAELDAAVERAATR